MERRHPPASPPRRWSYQTADPDAPRAATTPRSPRSIRLTTPPVNPYVPPATAARGGTHVKDWQANALILLAALGAIFVVLLVFIAIQAALGLP